MIELRTGVPGSGKTLSSVEELSKFVARWAKHPEEGRPIFVSGIPDLAIPHSPVPVKVVQGAKGGATVTVPDWDLMPDGSLVLFDEAQGFFPPRSSQSTPPDHVAWLNTHRHRGFDIWLTTQHPKLIDGSVRALVGKHKHYRRLFGGSRAMVYEWDACSDSLGGMKTAVIGYYSYPKKVYQFYKSAEIHTKQNFKLPLWLGIPILGVLMGIFFVPKAYSTISNGVSGRGLSSQTASASVPPAAPTGSIKPTPQVSALPNVPQAPAPQYVGCIVMKDRCSCITEQGSVVDEPPMCRPSTEKSGLLVKVHMQSTGSSGVWAARPMQVADLASGQQTVKVKP